MDEQRKAGNRDMEFLNSLLAYVLAGESRFPRSLVPIRQKENFSFIIAPLYCSSFEVERKAAEAARAGFSHNSLALDSELVVVNRIESVFGKECFFVESDQLQRFVNRQASVGDNRSNFNFLVHYLCHALFLLSARRPFVGCRLLCCPLLLI